MRRYLGALIAAVVIVGVLLGVRAMRPHSAAQASSLLYSVAKAHYGNLDVQVQGNGTVEATTSLNVFAQQSGTVSAVPVQVGTRVKAGQVLAKVSDQGALEGSLLSAQSQLAADKASLAQLVSPTPPSAAQVQAEKDRVQADQAMVQRDEAEISDLTVTSPISGEVASVSVQYGQVVQQGTQLFEIVQPGMVEVQTSVPEISIPNISVGQGVQVQTQDLGTLSAAVTSIGLLSSGSSRTGAEFPVTLTIENPPAGLRQGMQVTVNFTQAYLSRPGTIAFKDPQFVVAQVSGTVQNIDVAQNDAVQQGETLATLENQNLATQLAADGAQQASDEAQLQNLLHPTPPQPAQVTSVQQRISSDEANVARVRQELSELDITSPIDGVVTAVNVQKGDIVGPGLVQNAPFTVEDPNMMQVVVPIDEISIAQVKVGQRATVTASALPGETFQGVVAQLAPAGVTSQGVATFNVTVDVHSPGALKAGMSADVAIQVASVQHALLVPNEALSGYGKNATIKVLVNGTPKVRHVVMGLSNDVDTQILSGLKPGDEVVTAKASQGTLPFGNSSSRSGSSGSGGGK